MAVKYSIRLKYFIPLILIPTLVMVFFIFIGKNLLNHEKSVYLENGLSQTSRVLGQLVVSELEKINALKLQVSNSAIQLNENSDLPILAYKKISRTHTDHKVLMEKSVERSGLDLINLNKIIKSIGVAPYLEGQKTLIVLDPQLGLFALVNIDKTYFEVMTFLSDVLKVTFGGNNQFSTFMATKAGEILLGENPAHNRDISSFAHWSSFLEIQTSNTKTGMIEEHKQTKSPIAIGYFNIPQTNLMTLVMQEKRNLQLENILQNNMILILACYFCLTFFVAFLFSRKWEALIRRLRGFLDEMARGNYNVKMKKHGLVYDEFDQIYAAFDKVVSFHSSQYVRDNLNEKKKEQVAAISSEADMQAQSDSSSQNDNSELTAKLQDLSTKNKLLNTFLKAIDYPLVYFDLNGELLNIYSDESMQAFGEDLVGKSIGFVLKIPEHKHSELNSLLKKVFAAELDPSHLIDWLPRELKNYDEDIADLKLHYHRVLDAHGSLIAIGISAIDTTEEDILFENIEEEREYSQNIVELAENKFHYINFLLESNKIIKTMRTLLENPQDDSYLALARSAHTLKTLSNIYLFEKVQNNSQAMEDALDNLKFSQHGDKVEALIIVKENLEQIEAELLYFVQSYASVLGFSDLNEAKYYREFPLSFLREFYSSLDNFSSKDVLKETFFMYFLARPINYYLSFCERYALKTAGHYEKNIHPLKIEGENLPLVGEQYSQLLNVLLHGIDNSLNHGIEFSARRKSMGKDELGTLTLAFKRVDKQDRSFLMITLEDDGQGIDPDNIRNKLREIYADHADLGDILAEDDQSIIQHIFDQAFSGLDYESEESGKGVGMDAIQEVAQSLGGKATIKSVLGKGTILLIVVPWLS